MNNSDPRIGYFDDLAANWDNQEPSSQTMTDRLEQQAELLALRPGLSLLEVGCGTGKTTPWLADRVSPGRVTAVDFAPEMISIAKTKGIDADFICLDVCNDTLGSNVYDVILCFHSFPHFRDQSAALNNFNQAMKPDGRLLVMHMAGSMHINQFHANLDGPVNGDVLPVGSEWIALLDQVGLAQKTLIDHENLFYLEVTHRDK